MHIHLKGNFLNSYRWVILISPFTSLITFSSLFVGFAYYLLYIIFFLLTIISDYTRVVYVFIKDLSSL